MEGETCSYFSTMEKRTGSGSWFPVSLIASLISHLSTHLLSVSPLPAAPANWKLEAGLDQEAKAHFLLSMQRVSSFVVLVFF